MAARSQPASLFGALILFAASLYATRQAAKTLPSGSARPSLGRILGNVWGELGRDNVSVMAAGVAFYSFLSLFPGLSAVISLYGLAADPAVIGQQLAALSEVLPNQALQLVSGQLHTLTTAPPAKLGIGFALSLLFTFWSATSGSATLMAALTIAYEARDRRGPLGFYLRAIALTIGIGAFGLVSLFLIAVVPAVIEWLPLRAGWQGSIWLVRWPTLAALAYGALALVYRFAPARATPRWHWFAPGTIAAALLWLLGSAGFSFYVAHFGTYDKTYGTLGAAVVLLVWLYVSAYIVLAGAELNSEIEQRSSQWTA